MRFRCAFGPKAWVVSRNYPTKWRCRAWRSWLQVGLKSRVEQLRHNSFHKNGFATCHNKTLRQKLPNQSPSSQLCRNLLRLGGHRGSLMKGVTVNLLWDVAFKFDQNLRQSGTTALKPWQQEVRDYVSTTRSPPSSHKAISLSGARENGS
jgi:hypothetical protein